MTSQEAIKFLKIWRNAIESRGDGPFSEAVMALTYGIEAIEKQIPKNPWKESLADRDCPSCGAYLNFDALNEPVTRAPAFCECCGQRIDWSEEE